MRRPDLAEASFTKGIAIGEPLVASHPEVAEYQNRLARSYTNLGVFLYNSGRLDLAAGAYKKAITLREALVARQPDVPDYQNGLASSHGNLGAALADSGRPQEAAEAYQKAIKIREALVASHPDVPEYQSGLANSHGNLANALAALRRLDVAVGEYEKAISIGEALTARQPGVPEYMNVLANSYKNYGILVRDRGNLTEALAKFNQAARIALPGSPAAGALPVLIRDTENSLALANRLPAVLKGDAKPKDAAEGLSFARLCYAQSHYAAAARLCETALAADPKLAGDLRAQPRYNAACAAAQAAAGKGIDEPAPDESAKFKLRGQARDWLLADLELWANGLESGQTNSKADAVAAMRRWQNDPDLATVRESQALEKLPEAESSQWKALWGKVGALLDRANERQP